MTSYIDHMDDVIARHGHDEEHRCPKCGTAWFLGECDGCPADLVGEVDDDDDDLEDGAEYGRPYQHCAKTVVIRSARAGVMPIASYDGDRAWQGRVWMSRRVFGAQA